MDDTRPSSSDLRAEQLLLVLLPVDLHVRKTSLGHDKSAYKIRLDISLQLFKNRLILHGLAVMPVRIRDTRIIDEEINTDV